MALAVATRHPEPRRSARIASQKSREATRASSNRNKKEVSQAMQRAPRLFPDLIENPLAPLPDELVLEICEYIADGLHTINASKARKDLAALAMTCRYLHPFAMRYLYSKYICWSDNPKTSFLRTLAARPDLRNHLREVRVLSDLDMKAKKGRNLKEIKNQLRGLPIPDARWWLKKFAACPMDVEIALLMIHCPNVKVLDTAMFTPQNQWQSDELPDEIPAHLDSILRVARSVPKTLQLLPTYDKLQSLSIRVNGLCINQLGHLLLLPSLNKLSLWELSYSPEIQTIDDGLEWPVASRESKVQHIGICLSSVPSAPILSLLNSCKKISSFACNETTIMSNSVQWHSDVFEALEFHRDTLEVLEINANETYMDDWDRYADPYPPNQLIKTMHSLKELEVHLNVLMGKPQGLYGVDDQDGVSDPHWKGYHFSLRQLLPPQLVKLVLHIARSSLTQDRVDYDYQVRTLLPSELEELNSPLQDVHINYFHSLVDTDFPLKFCDMEESFQEFGKHFEYTILHDIVDEMDFENWIERLVSEDWAGALMAQHLESVFGEEWDVESSVVERLEMMEDSDVSEEEMVDTV